MYILDTDTLSLLWRNHHKVVEQAHRVGSSTPIVITQVTHLEVFKGRFASIITAANSAELQRAVGWLAETLRRLEDVRIVEFDDAVIAKFDELRVNKKLKKMGRPDLLIACFAIVYGVTLVTRNTKDFINVPGLKLANWAD